MTLQPNRYAPIFSFQLLVLLPQEACGSLPWRWPHELVTRRLKGPWTCFGSLFWLRWSTFCQIGRSILVATSIQKSVSVSSL